MQSLQLLDGQALQLITIGHLMRALLPAQKDLRSARI
jgi:hypothetical protein